MIKDLTIVKTKIEKNLEKERIKNELLLEKEKIIKEEREKIREMLKNGTAKKYKIFFNYKIDLRKIDDNYCMLHCLSEIKPSQYKKIKLKFSIDKFSYKILYENFNTSYGIKCCDVIVKNTLTEDNFHEVLAFGVKCDAIYNKPLYIQLCNI